MIITYSASRVICTTFGNERATLVLAWAREIVALDLDVEVELRICGRAVLEDRQPFAVVLTDAHVDRRRVTNGLRAITPLATFLVGNTLRVDIVLSRGGLALPVVVPLGIRASQRLQIVVAKRQRNSLGFGTCRDVLINEKKKKKKRGRQNLPG